MSKSRTLHEVCKPPRRKTAANAQIGRGGEARGSFSNSVVIESHHDLRSWSENLTTVAHDLKTPLTVIGGYIDILLEEKLGSMNAAQRDVLQEMKQNEGRLQRFIKNFLTYNASRTAPLQLSLRANDLNRCIREMVEVWQLSFRSKGVSLYFAQGRSLKPFSFDYHKVQHIVSNLLDNALKFSPPASVVWIETRLHQWERHSGGTANGITNEQCETKIPNTVRVTVTDAGPGIAPEFHEEIFQEFVRLEHDSPQEGTGLGLAIANRLVHLHDGTIWVESEPGAGCKFSFLLPLNRNQAAVPDAEVA